MMQNLYIRIGPEKHTISWVNNLEDFKESINRTFGLYSFNIIYFKQPKKSLEITTNEEFIIARDYIIKNNTFFQIQNFESEILSSINLVKSEIYTNSSQTSENETLVLETYDYHKKFNEKYIEIDNKEQKDIETKDNKNKSIIINDRVLNYNGYNPFPDRKLIPEQSRPGSKILDVIEPIYIKENDMNKPIRIDDNKGVNYQCYEPFPNKKLILKESIAESEIFEVLELQNITINENEKNSIQGILINSTSSVSSPSICPLEEKKILNEKKSQERENFNMFSLVNKKLEENKIEECKYEEKNPSENENILSEVISVYDYNEKKSGINRDKLQEEFENMLFEEEKDNFDKKNCLESANAAKSIEKIKVNSVNVLIFECIYCNIDLAHENF